jgi:hypothetical protein
MAERLGNVLYWVANTVAILLLVSGAIMGWAELRIGNPSNYDGMIFSFFLVLGTWLLGRACRHVLAGR